MHLPAAGAHLILLLQTSLALQDGALGLGGQYEGHLADTRPQDCKGQAHCWQ